MLACIGDIKALVTANMIELNDKVTNLRLVTSKRTNLLYNLPISITVGNAQVPLMQSVMNLGFTLVHHLTMNEHVSNIF